MIEVATAINSFASQAMQTDFVPPSEEAVFVLTSSELQVTIKRSIQEATASLLQEIEDLRARQDRDYERFSGDICDHGQRLRKLEKIEPQPLQRDRADILRALLAANGGKMLAKDARQKMHLSKQLFSMLVASMGDYIEMRPLHIDNRKKVLVLK
jgi:hypothetical protein